LIAACACGVADPVPLLKDPNDLDIDALLRKVIEKHSIAILKVFQALLQDESKQRVFSTPGDVTLVMDGRYPRYLSLRTEFD
jgi:hypothetical protein